MGAETPTPWQEANSRYLAASLHWLRLVLERGAEEAAPAAAKRALAADVEPPPALEALARLLGLSEFERDVLLLCVAMELDPGTAARCARSDADGLRYPTFALALAQLPGAAWDALSRQSPLRYWQLVEVEQAGGQPLATSALRADERIVNYVNGLNELDDRISSLVDATVSPGASEATMPPSLRSVVDEIARRWWQGTPAPVIQLLGPDGRAKRDVARHAAAMLNRVLVRLPVDLLPSHPHELDQLARIWHRESVLLPIALYLDADEADDALDVRVIRRLLAYSDAGSLLATREPRGGFDRPAIAIDVARPHPSEQRGLWEDAIGPDAPPAIAAALAGQFDLAASEIAEIADLAAAEQPICADDASYDRLWNASVASTRVRLDQLAQRIEPRAHWDDLVLPAAETALLRQIADQVAHRTRVYADWGFAERMSRGLGISVLFSGPSGTGKTMAAEVLAAHLRLSLYRIDLSAVVSKYIGETEKNLRRLFDVAESGAALLFFDEADALFGKRSEVKDAHDRYANIEVNYLLQRMESYRGLAVLATNMRGALDQAFLRRLRFIITFPFPGVKQRRAIWERAFPARAAVEELDFDYLARLQTTGAMIQSIALNAAFRAARSERPVSMAMVVEAAGAEFLKLELPVPELLEAGPGLPLGDGA